tara:strand:- start:2 stop:640 length:639 start_codon:yes stop_codon:yes gene_type:complete
MSRETIFEEVKEKAGSHARTASWYRKQVRTIAKRFQDAETVMEKMQADEKKETLTDDKFQDTNRSRTDVRKGHLYLFEYSATMERIPYWDEFPLLYVIDHNNRSFRGVNLHYMQPKYRNGIIKTLIEDNLLRVPKTTFHKYIRQGVRSRFLDLGVAEWQTAIFLPVENFVYRKQKKLYTYRKDKIWNETYTKRKDRFSMKRVIELYPGQSAE